MGSSSSSTVNQKYETNIVNKSDVDILNKNVNNFVANTVVNQAANCSASISQLQLVDLSGMDIAGDLTIGEIDQTQTANVTFDCLQVSEFKNDIANGVMAEYQNALKRSFSTEALDKMTAAADSTAKNSFGTTGSVSADSTVNVDYKFNNTTILNTKLQNIIESSITNNMSLSDVQNCISTVQNSQKVVLANAKVGGNVNIGAIKQDQAASLMAKCVQQKNNANKISNSIATQTGLQIDDQNKVVKSTEISSTASSTATNAGFFDGIANMITSLFAGLLAGPIAIACSVLLSICCCIICIVLIAKITSGSSNSQPGQGEDQGQGEGQGQDQGEGEGEE